MREGNGDIQSHLHDIARELAVSTGVIDSRGALKDLLCDGMSSMTILGR